MINRGKVYIVGAGPGDPDLISVKGLRLLKTADVIVHDRLVSPELLALANTNAEIIRCCKISDKLSDGQGSIQELFIDPVNKGKIVVRLKNGDPFIFGKGDEEALELKKAGIEFEIVPGVSSGYAAPVYAGIPLTMKGLASSLHFISGYEDPDSEDSTVNYSALARIDGTLVFFMSIGHLEEISSSLIKNGKSPDTPCAVIHKGCTPQQVTVTGKLKDISGVVEKSRVKSPSIVVIGEVCTLASDLAWFENSPKT